MMTKAYVLIVGSGIHQQARTTKPADPLASWAGLLKAVRRKLEIKSGRKHGSLPPSIEWEKLVADYATKAGGRRQRERNVLRVPNASRSIFMMSGEGRAVMDSNPWDAAKIYGEPVRRREFPPAWHYLGKILEQG